MTNFHVDWFQVTEPLNSDFTDWLRHELHVAGYEPQHGHGYHGYRDRNEYGGSVVEMWSDYDERMGRNWRFSGGSWEAIRRVTDNSPNWRYFVRKWAEIGKGSISRIDLASDFYDSDARTVAADIMHGMNEQLIRKRSWRQIDNNAFGYTFYAGSRESDVMLRCYDKGAELDLEPFKLTRTEFEVKKSKGQAIGGGLQNLMRHSDDSERNVGYWLERIIYGLMLDFIPIHTLDRLGVMGWGVMPITIGSWLPKNTAQDTWFWNVVVPAVVRRVRLPEGGIDDVFWQTFTDEISRQFHAK